MKTNAYGFPVFEDDDFMIDTSAPSFDQNRMTDTTAVSQQLRFEKAKEIAAEARARNFPPPCECRECNSIRNLPSVLRILAKWVPMDRGA